MDEHESRVSANEAKKSLEGLKRAQSEVVSLLRPPIWLNALSGLVFGVVTIGASLQRGSGVWTAVLYVSVFAFISTYVYWLRECRRLGVKAKFFPSRTASRLFYIGQGIFFGVIVFGSQALHANGVTWAPYVAALINAAAFSYLLHWYPTTEWGTKAAAQ